MFASVASPPAGEDLGGASAPPLVCRQSASQSRGSAVPANVLTQEFTHFHTTPFLQTREAPAARLPPGDIIPGSRSVLQAVIIEEGAEGEGDSLVSCCLWASRLITAQRGPAR